MKKYHIFIAAIAISMSLFSQSSLSESTAVERKNYKALGDPVGPYVHAVKHGETLYLSGLTAFGTKAQGASMASQIRAIFQQIETVTKAEGSNLNNLIKVTIFVTDFSDIDELRETLFEVYGDHIPASSLVHVAGLFSGDLKIEIEAIIGL